MKSKNLCIEVQNGNSFSGGGSLWMRFKTGRIIVTYKNIVTIKQAIPEALKIALIIYEKSRRQGRVKGNVTDFPNLFSTILGSRLKIKVRNLSKRMNVPFNDCSRALMRIMFKDKTINRFLYQSTIIKEIFK